MPTKLKRVQMLIEPDQHRALEELAEREGKSVAQVTRQMIDIGLSVMQSRQAYTQRSEALERADALRQAIRERQGGDLEVSVTEDIEAMRRDRDGKLFGRSD